MLLTWLNVSTFFLLKNDSLLTVFKKALQSSSYFESIPTVPEYGIHRRYDANKLREIRKRLDNANDTSEADMIAMDCMDELVEICSGKILCV